MDDINPVCFKKQRRKSVYKICWFNILESKVCIAGITFNNDETGRNVWPNYIYFFKKITNSVSLSKLLKGSINWPHSRNTIKRIEI